MAKQFNWTRVDAGWRAEMPGNVTIFATPDRTTGLFGIQAARGTKWRAGATHWDEATRTASRFGKDVYSALCDDARSAQRLAESVYLEAQQAA